MLFSAHFLTPITSWLLQSVPMFGRRSEPDSDGWTYWIWWFEAVLSSSLFWQPEDQQWWLQHMAGRLEVDRLAFIQALNTERPFQMLAKQLWTWQRDNHACCLFVSVEKAILSSSYSSFISCFNARAVFGIVNSRAKTEIKTVFKVISIKELFFPLSMSLLFLERGFMQRCCWYVRAGLLSAEINQFCKGSNYGRSWGGKLMSYLSSNTYKWQNVNTQLTALPSLTVSEHNACAAQTEPISLDRIIISAASATRTRVNRSKSEIITDSVATRTESQGRDIAVDLWDKRWSSCISLRFSACSKIIASTDGSYVYLQFNQHCKREPKTEPTDQPGSLYMGHILPQSHSVSSPWLFSQCSSVSWPHFAFLTSYCGSACAPLIKLELDKPDNSQLTSEDRGKCAGKIMMREREREEQRTKHTEVGTINF